MLPFATTTISVLRNTSSVEDSEPLYDGDSPTARQVVASGVGANIGGGTGSAESRSAGSQNTIRLKMQCNPFGQDLSHLDGILDETTGIIYDLQVAVYRQGVGLDHWQCQLTRTEGLM